jgi:hypothetical protein
MMIVNDDSRVINKLEASLIDDTRVIIYDHHMFIVQATNGCRPNVFRQKDMERCCRMRIESSRRVKNQKKTFWLKFVSGVVFTTLHFLCNL